MTGTQLLVLALIFAAFGAGWAARGAAGEDAEKAARDAPPTGDEVDAPDVTHAQSTGDEIDAPDVTRAQPAGDIARILEEAASAQEAVIDAWLDGVDPARPLATFEAALARVHARAGSRRDASFDHALAALTDADVVLDELRAGRSMTATASRRLGEAEERLARAREADGGEPALRPPA